MILDGAVLSIDRIGADRPYYSGKKKHHGMSVQVLTWASDALPAAMHDVTAARALGIPATLAADDIKCWADKAYRGAGPAIRVPIRQTPARLARHHNAITPRSAASANVPWPPSSPGDSCGGSAGRTTRITAVTRAVVALELAT